MALHTGEEAVQGGEDLLRLLRTSRVPAQLTRGQLFERKVLNELGLVKNTKAVAGGSIRDSMVNGVIIEIKDQKYIYRSRQLMNFLASGDEVHLIVSPASRVSSKLVEDIADSDGNIRVRIGPGKYVPYPYMP